MLPGYPPSSCSRDMKADTAQQAVYVGGEELGFDLLVLASDAAAELPVELFWGHVLSSLVVSKCLSSRLA